MVDGSHEQRSALERQASGDGRALRAARSCRVWKALFRRSLWATSNGRAGRGNGPESTPARLGLSSETALGRTLDERELSEDARCGSMRPRGGDVCPPNPPAWPWPALSACWNVINGVRRTFAQLAVRGSGPRGGHGHRAKCQETLEDAGSLVE
jgi:hypothetical protein